MAASSVMERLLVVGDKEEEEVKDIFREERVARIRVDSELVVVVVTLGEMEVGIKLFPVGEGEDLLTLGQIS